MGVTEFETFEHEFLKLIEEIQIVTCSEARLRETLHKEATRAEAAEAGRDTAEHAAAEARAAAAAASAAAAQASAVLAKTQDDLAATKMQFELAERHRAMLEEKCSELTSELETLRKKLQKLKPLEASSTNIQKQYMELQERIEKATNDARSEATRLEAELRRVEKCAAGGIEIRERARLAAAAHVRERRLANAELQHTNHELRLAKAEATKLNALVVELQSRLAICNTDGPKPKNSVNLAEEALTEVRAALEAERAGAARLEKALAAALTDNATLAAKINSVDNSIPTGKNELQKEPPPPSSSNISPIDSFLAE